MHGEVELAYQSNHKNVFVHECGTGFHRQLMVAASLNLGISAKAMHYLSEKPCEIKDNVQMVSADAEERA